MSYENNHSIQFDLDHLSQYEEVVDLEGKKSELDEVYAKAEKASEYKVKANLWEINKKRLDEYESKAKAWDKYKAHMESHIAGEINEEELVSDLKSDYFESGESND